jgi:signal transduction histidine kinase
MGRRLARRLAARWLGIVRPWAVLLVCGWCLLCPAAAAVQQDRPGCDRVGRITQAQRQWGSAAGPQEWVVLPDRLPRERFVGQVRLRYRFILTPCGSERALLVPHMGAAYRVLVDGAAAARIAPAPSWWLPDPAEDALTNPRVPALFRLPESAREVQVELEGSLFIPVGSWPLTVGPLRDVAPKQAELYRRAIDWTLSAGTMVTVVGAVAMALAVVRRQRHASLVWFALACLAWVARGIYSTATTLPLPGAWFETGVALLVLLLGLPLAIATLHLLGRWSPRWRALALGTMLLVLGLLGTGLMQPGLEVLCRTVVYQLMLFWMVVQCVMSCRHRQVIGRWRGWLLVAGYMALLSGAAHDFTLVQGGLPITDDTMSMLVWGYLALLVAVAVVGADHVMHALNQARDLNQALEQRVTERSAALAATYEHLQSDRIAQARERARQEERERIVREMHDGIGGQLMTALRGVERGALTGERLTQVLQDSLDDLRLLLDASHADTHLAQALAAWRHRWDPRLEALGLVLDWQVDDELDGLDMPPDVVLQVMRILQESVVNALKHAQARCLVVRATLQRPTGDAPVLWLEVEDDGIGLAAATDAPRVAQHGLRSMHTRSREIGATLALVSGASGGTRLSLTWPGRVS